MSDKPWIGFPLAAALLTACGFAARADDGAEFFEKKIRPILVEQCYQCHSAASKKVRGGLRLDSRAGLLQGGDRGPAVAPGEPDKSLLIEAVGYKNTDVQMPKKRKLPDSVVADLTAWVKMGAPWGKDDGPVGVAPAKPAFDLQQRKRDHWAWRPIHPPEPPAVKDAAWARDPADRFLLAKLEEKNLSPAPPADKRTLLRRLYFDLIGLPPSSEQVAAFVKNEAADAYEKEVDRLLASPQFGVRWARHWLDLVRYGETRGHEFDYTIPNAYQYRDYVIRALNADVPYNQFTTEHLAGDLLEKPRLNPTDGSNESIIGTGFWFLGEEVHSPVDVSQDQADRFDNRIDVMGKTFLGLTVACARCHDHKFDAISTKDYYSLFGLLESCNYRLARFDSLEHNRQVARDIEQARERVRPLIERNLAAAARPAVERMADYLIAARDAIHAGARTGESSERVAVAHKLDVVQAKKWIAAVHDAEKNASDPLHAWAMLCGDDAHWLADATKQAESAPPNGAEVIVDYANSRPGQWMPDGSAFGDRPARPGDLHLSGDATHPVVQLTTNAAAEYDRTWDVLKLAPGAENESGALGRMVRSGRTIRTPTFTINPGMVLYRVKGAGMVYAAVDSHMMIAGPLHGQLVADIPASDSLHWVALDLTPYKGRRAHLEFTAREGSDFAVASVVQAEQTPRSPNPVNHALITMLSGDDASTPERLAAGYQRLFVEVTKRLDADQTVGTPDAADYAALANWLLHHPELLPDEVSSKTLHETIAAALAEQKKLAAQILRESRLAIAMQDGDGVDEHVFKRGSYKTPGDDVPRRFLEALAGPNRLSIAHGSGRLELARQITDPVLDPFLPRVMVNRIWGHLFGRGIVASVDNFGVLGEPPTYPELLDFLADKFVKDGWSIKKTIRALVLTSAYRMSSQPTEEDKTDPQNLLLHRMPLRRLEGEAIRDAMLSISGRLDSKMYGPSVPVHLTPFLTGRGRPADGPLDGDGRRSLYIAIRRNFLSPMMLAFDTPSPFSTVGRRTVSNVPAEALILMNDPFVHQQAALWAKRVMGQGGSDKERITRMYEDAFSRPPTDDESAACLGFLTSQAKAADKKPDDPAVWADMAHMLFNVKEFIYIH